MPEFYLLGIKGSGMASLAKALLCEHKIKGADYENYYYTEDGLEEIKIDNIESFEINKKYLYIIGNAFRNTKYFEIVKKNNLDYVFYGEFINLYFKSLCMIAVAGSHGKTTTSKILASILPNSSYIIGDGSGKFKKTDRYFILEACEYKNTFLNYNPIISIILNIDFDHPDFFLSESEYIESFKKFADKSKIIIINGDDKKCKKIINNDMITFGIDKQNDVYFEYKCDNNKTIIYINNRIFEIPFVGTHYAYNFVGAYIAYKLLSMDEIDKEILKNMSLPKRRLEEKNYKNYFLIADYAHHPTEIKCLRDSLVKKYNMKINVFFEPHTLSRTKALLKDFKNSLDLFESVYLLPIFYSVREKIDIITENDLYSYLGYKKIFKDEIKKHLKNNMINLFLGAGDLYYEFYNLNE